MNADVNTEVLNKIYDLYVMDTKHYIQQSIYGNWKTINTLIDTNEKPLLNYKVKGHFNKYMTLGVFSGKVYTKFITFDVDFPNDTNMAKWVVYKICDALRNEGINDYYISFSGSKGYHVELFISDLIDLQTAKTFYFYIINKIDILQYRNEGEVEFRPTNTQAVKIPLGIQQKTKKYCGFCIEEESLKVMSEKQSQKYLLTIKKISRQIILDSLNRNDIKYCDTRDIKKTEKAISTHKPLKIYNETMQDIENKVIDLINDGLKVKGSRHNSLLYIAMFFNGCGETKEQIETDMIDWMKQQNPNMYTTPMNECIEDIHKIVDYVIEHNSCIHTNNKDLTVSKEELDIIIKKCATKGEKQLAYAMLVHSKRFANQSGIFYMSQFQMQETTGMTDRNARNVIPKLIENGLIEATELNRKQKGSFIKLPNKYKMLIQASNNTANIITYNFNANQNDFSNCLKSLYQNNELKTILPRRQYESLIA